MKKKYCLLALIIFLFGVNTVFACTGNDGCTGCANSTVENECKKSAAYAAYQNSSSCSTECKGIQSSSDYNKCVQNCEARKNNASGGSNESSGNTTIPGMNYNNGTSSSANPSKTPGSQTENITMNSKDTTDLNCDSLFGTNTAVGKYIHDIYNIIKFVVPLLLLALSIKDFGTGILSQNDNAVKVALNKFWRRLLIAVVILVLPTILNFVLDALGINTCFL